MSCSVRLRCNSAIGDGAAARCRPMRKRWRRGDFNHRAAVLRGAVLTTRSLVRIVHIQISVKSWTENLPSVAAVRPSHCPACGGASRPVGESLGLHGHGLRSRLIEHSEGPGQRAQLTTVMVRRYLCQLSAAVVMSVPAAVLRAMRYSASTVALALGLWSHGGRSARAVRASVSSAVVVGATAASGWASLQRWSRSSQQRFPKLPAWPPPAAPRAAAACLVSALSALSVWPTGAVIFDACAGACRAH